MCQLLPAESTLRAVLGAVVAADVTIEKRRVVPSSRIQRIYGVDLSDGGRLLLVMAPPSMLRLLRSEQWLVESEATVVRWVRDVLTREKLAVSKVLNLDGATAPCSSSCTDTGRHPSAETPAPAPAAPDPNAYHRSTSDLLTLLPPLLLLSSSTSAATISASSSLSAAGTTLSATSLEASFAVFSQPHVPSIPAAALRQPLNPSECKIIDAQIGSLAWRLSRLTSPSRRFGPALAVLSPPDSSTGSSSTANVAHASQKTVSLVDRGAGTWSMAFHSLLEGILRDAEDMAVIIPYGPIRKQFRRLGYLLDGVITPRLVLVDAADYANVLVATNTRLSPSPSHPTTTDSTRQGTPSSSTLEVTGLADWSNCVFGDPLFMRVFSEEPSPEFLRGFNGGSGGGSGRTGGNTTRSGSRPAQAHDEKQPDHNRDKAVDDGGGDHDYGDDATIEDRETSGIRLLLYQCYHLTVGIVREFYRPRGGSSARELDARRRLNGVLGRLAEVEDDPKRRHRRPSGDMSPAKKPKQDE